MNAALVLFTHELRAKSRLFIACAVLAVVPFLATLLPNPRGNARDVVAIAGGFLAIIMGSAIAWMMSRTAIVNDLAERRMSFWFAKPIRPAALWLGKASAALVTCLLCFAMMAMPAMLFAGPAWKHYWTGDRPVLVVAVLGMVFAFLLGHALNTVVRSRSLLLALDFLFLLAAAGALALIVWPVLLGQALSVMRVLTIAIATAIAVALAIAPVWQLRHGRADIRRSHVAFSRFFWPAIGVILLIAGGYVAWLVSATPEDFDGMLMIHQPPRGTKVLVTGGTRGRADYTATFLIDRATGQYERVTAPPWWGLESSMDGKVVAWLRPAGFFSGAVELYVNGRGTGIEIGRASSFVLSDDGTRAAVDTGNAVTVYDVATGRMLMSAAGLDPRATASFWFVTNDLVRVVEVPPLRITELDVRTRTKRVTAERPMSAPRGAYTKSVSADGTRLFVGGPNVIADGRTGATIATIPGTYVTARMLHDGTVAGISCETGAPHLHLYAPDGRRLHDLALTPTRNVWISGEIEGGKLILATIGAMYVVDVRRGAVVRKLEQVTGPLTRNTADPRLIRYGADQELVGRGKGRQLVVWKHEGRAQARPLLQSH